MWLLRMGRSHRSPGILMQAKPGRLSMPVDSMSFQGSLISTDMFFMAQKKTMLIVTGFLQFPRMDLRSASVSLPSSMQVAPDGRASILLRRISLTIHRHVYSHSSILSGRGCVEV